MTAPLLKHARHVNAAMVFHYGFVDPEEHATVAELIERVRTLAAGRALTFLPGRAAYPDFDDFWAITVKTADDGQGLCFLADRWRGAEDMTFALSILRKAFRSAAPQLSIQPQAERTAA